MDSAEGISSQKLPPGCSIHQPEIYSAESKNIMGGADQTTHKVLSRDRMSVTSYSGAKLVQCGAAESTSMNDERGFTVAERNFKMPEFSYLTLENSREKILVAPEIYELDLDSNQVAAGRSFLTSESVNWVGISGRNCSEEFNLENTILSSTSWSSRNCGEDFNLDNTTSAVINYPLGSTSSCVQQSLSTRTQNVLHRVMNRLDSSCTASSVVDDISMNLASAKMLKKLLLDLKGMKRKLDLNGLLFTIMGWPYKKERKRQKVLAVLLTYTSINVNERASNGMTALHYAVQDYDIESTKILVAFGANVNATNQDGRTPLELLQLDIERNTQLLPSSEGSGRGEGSYEEQRCHSRLTLSSKYNQVRYKSQQSKRELCTKCAEFLRSVGAVESDLAQRVAAVPHVQMFPQVPSSNPSFSRHHRKSYVQVLDWEAQITSHYSELDRSIHSRLENASTAGYEDVFSASAAISLVFQLKEMKLFQKSGSRVLCLDGGGIKGLVQLEMLIQLEKCTGRRIVELFDWIIGTSTGGVIALGLVYAKKSLVELRKLYFKMKDEVFAKKKGRVSFNTTALERIFKEEFSETRCMDDETYPRVLISAVKKEHINLKLHFFNNCFNDELCKHMPVWKVARYTCAAPVLFGESDQYVDGGILANNPSDSGLSKIQSFYRSRGEKLPLSLVVSVGSGKYPSQTIGKVDFLFVGSQGWSSLAGTSNLLELLSYALVEPSVADDNCKSRCEEQGVRYFRLNPRMEEVVGSGETDVATLICMILQTRKELEERPEFSNLVLCLHELSHASNQMHAHLNLENREYFSSVSSPDLA